MFKSKRDIELFIVDVFVAIKKIEEYIKDFDDKEEFRQDSLYWDATIRQLEIIGEALNKLLDDETFNQLSPKYFRKIVNFRNVIAHGYFGIDVDEVWDVLTDKLKLLYTDLENIVKCRIDLSEAIASEIVQYQKLNDMKIVSFLNFLQKKTDTKKELSMPFVIDKVKDPFYKEGIEKGIEKGKIAGKQEEQRAIAISLLDILDDKTMSQKVGLSLEEVKKLRDFQGL